MPLPALTDTLSDARTQWLGGDSQAWPRYVECCLRLEAELRKAPRATSPTAPRPAAGDRPRPPSR